MAFWMVLSISCLGTGFYFFYFFFIVYRVIVYSVYEVPNGYLFLFVGVV
jgi:hypothetical protein